MEKRKELGSGKTERKSVQSAKSKTGRTKPSILFSDDDDGSKREPLEDPEQELRLRFEDTTGAILQTVVDGLAYDHQALKEFVALDDAHTGSPRSLKNPGGYYRALLKQFYAARSARQELEKRERLRAVERALSAPKPEAPRPVCELGLCTGGGELCEAGGWRPCDCTAGRNLSPKVKELMEQMRQGVA